MNETTPTAPPPWSQRAPEFAAPFTHDQLLMALSFLLCVLTTLAAFELTARARSKIPATARPWLAFAGIMFGAGILVVHVLGMFALESPLKRGLALFPTIASAILPLFVGAAGFAFGGLRPNALRLFFVSVWLAHGVPVLHYIGVWGLQIDASTRFSPINAGVLSLAALAYSAVAYYAAHASQGFLTRLAMACVVSAGIAAGHYWDIGATTFTPNPRFEPAAPAPQDLLPAYAIAAAVAFALAVSLIAVVIDRFSEARRLSRSSRNGTTYAPNEEEEGIVRIPV